MNSQIVGWIFAIFFALAILINGFMLKNCADKEMDYSPATMQCISRGVSPWR